MTKKLQTIFEYIAAIFIILDCYSVISIEGANGNYIKLLAVLFMIVLLFFPREKILSIPQKMMLLFSIYVPLQFLFSLVNHGISVAQYWFNQILIFVVACTYLWNHRNSFFKAFCNVMYIVCACSLFFYVFGTILKVIPYNGYIYATWGNISAYKNYYYLYEESQGTWFFGTALTRNIGIFAEGPMFAYCICIAAWWETFTKQFSKARWITYILAICTAFSVTGFIFVGILILFKYLQVRSKKFMLVTVKQIALLAVIFLGAMAGIYLLLDKLDSVSGVSRMAQYSNALKIWGDHILLGIGYKMNTEGGFASGILLALVECGILGSLVYVIPIVGSLIRSIHRKEYEYIALSIGFAEILMLTVVPYKVVTICITAVLWIYLLKGKNEENECR